MVIGVVSATHRDNIGQILSRCSKLKIFYWFRRGDIRSNLALILLGPIFSACLTNQLMQTVNVEQGGAKFVFGTAWAGELAPPEADAGMRTAQPSTTQAPADSKGPAVSPAETATPSAAIAVTDVSALLLRGDLALAVGDIVAARQFFQAGAEAGNGKAALRLAETFDQYFLSIMDLEPHADRVRAVFWYMRARELGSESADNLLKRLEASTNTPGETASNLLPPNAPGPTAEASGNSTPAAPNSSQANQPPPADARTATRALSDTPRSTEETLATATNVSSNASRGVSKSPSTAANTATPQAERDVRPRTDSEPQPAKATATPSGSTALEPMPVLPERATSSIPISGSAPTQRPVLTAENLAMLLARGDRLLAAGDVTAARLFYERGANAGDGTAALRLGETFDPRFLARARLGFVVGDAVLADHWYGVARDLGNADVAFLLKSGTDR